MRLACVDARGFLAPASASESAPAARARLHTLAICASNAQEIAISAWGGLKGGVEKGEGGGSNAQNIANAAAGVYSGWVEAVGGLYAHLRKCGLAD